MAQTQTFQITLFEKWSQFSRVADRQITAGLSREDVKARLSHMAPDAREEVERCVSLTGHASFRDRDGRLGRLDLHK